MVKYMHCFKESTCVNYRTRCFECGSVADINNPYPRYTSKEEHERRLLWLLNGVPELLSKAHNSQEDAKTLASYLVNNGVRVDNT